MFDNDERLNMTPDNIPFIDTITARDLVHMMYSAGLIEMPSMNGPTLDITSCPVDPAYTLRDDLPSRRPDLSLRAETCVTDYDLMPDTLVDPPVLNLSLVRTTRIAITFGDD